jgi:hypothetical protein
MWFSQSFAFFQIHILYRYVLAAPPARALPDAAVVGRVQVKSSLPTAWKRLVSTLEPVKWKTGFKVCAFKFSTLCRYAVVQRVMRRTDEVVHEAEGVLVVGLGHLSQRYFA